MNYYPFGEKEREQLHIYSLWALIKLKELSSNIILQGVNIRSGEILKMRPEVGLHKFILEKIKAECKLWCKKDITYYPMRQDKEKCLSCIFFRNCIGDNKE